MPVETIYSCLSELGVPVSDISVELRRDAAPSRDATIFCTGATPLMSKLAAALEGRPEIVSVGFSGRKITVRFDDAAVAAAGDRIAQGHFPATAPSRINRPILVGFLGPNLSKALHVGHLRNMILGNATVATLRGAGFQARSYSLVGDIGRNVCEAMAGWRLLEADARAAMASLKSDHCVGLCYRAYLGSRRGGTASADPPDPCHREHRPVGDEADVLLQLWRSGDTATRELWSSICSLVESGHAETLRRLGIEIDARYLESDHLAAAESLVQEGMRRGLLTRDHTGTTYFATGLAEYPRLILARSDGFPTEHARVLAVFQHIFGSRDACEHIDWNGTEWEPAQKAIVKLMDALEPDRDQSRHRPMFHGMVLIDGTELSSSEGEPLLIDDALDRLEASEDLAQLAGDRLGSTARAQLAALVLKSYFLSAPQTKPLAFSWEKLMSRKANPGWTIAQSWIHAGRTQDRGASPRSEPQYRTAVLQAESLPYHLQVAAGNLRVSGLFSFLVKYCERLLAADECPYIRAVSRTVLDRCTGYLGLLPLCRTKES